MTNQILGNDSSSFMGIDGRVSAFAAVHGELFIPDASTVPSQDNDEEPSLQSSSEHENSSALSDITGKLPITPKCVDDLGEGNLAVRLENNEAIVVIGIFSLWVKHGRVSFLGAFLEASSTVHHVFTPVTHAIPSISAVSDHAELVISNNDDGIRYLGDVSPYFAGIWDPTYIDNKLSFHVLSYHSKDLQVVSKELRRLALEKWYRPVYEITARVVEPISKVLVCGATGTGTSTLCRVLINRMLTISPYGASHSSRCYPSGVVLLDIDPGQPEVAAPGILYLAHVRTPLFGPPFSSLIVPGMTKNKMLRMHYLGAFTPRDAPFHYQNCVSDLLALYREYKGLPLVVNTPGWNSGTGKAILLSAVQQMSLTEIVCVGDALNLPLNHLLRSGNGDELRFLTELPPQPEQTPLMNGRCLRAMQLQAYLHASRVVNDRVSWDHFPLTVMRGYRLADAGLTTKNFMIVLLNQDIKAEYVVDALSDSVAAIVIIKRNSPLYGLSSGTRQRHAHVQTGMHIKHTPDGHLPYLVFEGQGWNPLDPKTTECVGLGLVTVEPFEQPAEQGQLRIKSPFSQEHVQIELERGHRIALVLSQQLGTLASLESDFARELWSERLQAHSESYMGARHHEPAETLTSAADMEDDPTWKGFFGELEQAAGPRTG